MGAADPTAPFRDRARDQREARRRRGSERGELTLTLYQAEWCPFSSAVRERLTELGHPFVAQPVEPQPEQRATMRERIGTDGIPTLVTDDGQVFDGTEAIFAYLATLDGWAHAEAHRTRYDEHRRAREKDTPGRLLEKLS